MQRIPWGKNLPSLLGGQKKPTPASLCEWAGASQGDELGKWHRCSGDADTRKTARRKEEEKIVY